MRKRFVSYAQNFEDVILWRALKGQRPGVYIDIGAQDPIVDSVSLAFHERGWSGIHVEPSGHYATRLRESRPNDVVLQAAVGDVAGVRDYFEIANTGISTLDPEIAEGHRRRGFTVVRSASPVVTLDSVLELANEREVHWMKVDVEGFEHKVLRGWKKSPIRPWVVLLESCLPLSQEPTHEQWEPLLLAKGYRFAYFDGLNRFYVAKDRTELLPSFEAPPNVYDEFELCGTANSTFHLHVRESAEREIASLREALDVKECQATQSIRSVHERAEREAALATVLRRGLEDALALAQQRVKEATESAASSESRNAQVNAELRDRLEGALTSIANLERKLGEDAVLSRDRLEAQLAQYRLLFDAEIERLRSDSARREARLIEQHEAANAQLIEHIRRGSDREARTAEEFHELKAWADTALRQHAETIATKASKILQELNEQGSVLAAQSAGERAALETRLAEFRADFESRHASDAESWSSLLRLLEALEEGLRESVASISTDLRSRSNQAEAELLARDESNREALNAVAEALNRQIESGRRDHERSIEALAGEIRRSSTDLDVGLRGALERQLAQQREVARDVERRLGDCIDSAAQRLRDANYGANARLAEDLAAARLQIAELCESIEDLQVPVWKRMLRLLRPARRNSAKPFVNAATHESSPTTSKTDVLPASSAVEEIDSSRDAVEPTTVEPSYSTHLASQNRTSRQESLFMNQLDMNENNALATLMTMYDESFVLGAYRLVLQRAPDEGGLKYYLARVRGGTARERIIYELAASEEGRRKSSNVPEVSRFLEHFESRQPSRVASALRRVKPPAADPLDQRFNALENLVFRLVAQQEGRLNALHASLMSIESTVERVARAVEQQESPLERNTVARSNPVEVERVSKCFASERRLVETFRARVADALPR
jgi:FkbM family methyltransferase